MKAIRNRLPYLMVALLILTTVLVNASPARAVSYITTDVLPWLSTGYRYMTTSNASASPSGWELNSYDDSSWSLGNAGFGAGGPAQCPLDITRQTTWTLGTALLVRHTFTLPAGATNVRVQVAIDNDVIGIWVNGNQIPHCDRHKII